MRPTTTFTLSPAAALLAALLPLVAATALGAQDLTRKAGPQRRPVVITGATIHTMHGEPVRAGTIWFDGGRIRAILAAGQRPELPAGAEPLLLDGTGKHVYPGLIGAVTRLGLVEIGQVQATIDDDEVGDLNPEVRAAVAVNPDSTVLPVTRRNGVLNAGVFPRGGLIPGRAAVIALEGWTWESMAIEADAGVVVRWPRMPADRGKSTAEARKVAQRMRDEVTDAFTSAAAYHAARAAEPSLPADLRWEPLAPVLAGEKPVFVFADSAEEIRSALAWAIPAKLRPVIVGGRGAREVVDLLLRHDVPVIVEGTHRLPSRRDAPYDEPFTLPRDLERAGVRWCLASGESFYNERNLPYQAATAVVHGLPRDAALRAITLRAAEILGVGDVTGSLAPGKRADLIVTDGDPLEITTRVTDAFSAGRRLRLTDKQVELAAKYREKYVQMGLLPAAEDR